MFLAIFWTVINLWKILLINYAKSLPKQMSENIIKMFREKWLDNLTEGKRLRGRVRLALRPCAMIFGQITIFPFSIFHFLSNRILNRKRKIQINETKHKTEYFIRKISSFIKIFLKFSFVVFYYYYCYNCYCCCYCCGCGCGCCLRLKSCNKQSNWKIARNSNLETFFRNRTRFKLLFSSQFSIFLNIYSKFDSI